ncbi:hypothetical protein TNCV_2495061 [Trichonephila clavipes]|nr:hypothetical protein TNCV_2495061 [Trichonephila clavipes]
MIIGARAIEAPLKGQLSTDFLANNILTVEKKTLSNKYYSDRRRIMNKKGKILVAGIYRNNRRIKTRQVTTEFMQVRICTRTLQSVCLRTKRQQKMGFSSRRQLRMSWVSQKN